MRGPRCARCNIDERCRSTFEEQKRFKKEPVKFIFQPAEEGAPAGEKVGVGLMVEEGVLNNPKVDDFRIARSFDQQAGVIEYRPKDSGERSDWFTIKVYGKQSHGSAVARCGSDCCLFTQIIAGLQTIVSRQTDLTQARP